MRRTTASTIEKRLKLELPAAWLAVLKSENADFFHATGLFDNLTSILVHNLELRDPESIGWRPAADWPSGYLLVGIDGGGNMLFLDTKRVHVLFWDHETDTFEDLGTIKRYIAAQKPVAPRPSWMLESNDHDEVELVVSRVDPPQHSILDPIRLDEWKAFIETDDSITWRGYREARSPFTGKKERIPYPGMARWKDKTMGNVDLLLSHGRIRVSEIINPRSKPTKEAKTKLTAIAKALGATCFGERLFQ